MSPKRCGQPEITPAIIAVGKQANIRDASLLVVQMMEYRLKYIEWLEKEVQKQTECLHLEREPKKFIRSYNRVMKMVKTISELISEDRFDAFHLQLLIRMRKVETPGPEVFERPEPLCYIH
jgi:hypothetical protein